jgi:hypothetical protein
MVVNQRQYDILVRNLLKNKIPHTVLSHGSTKAIEANGNKYQLIYANMDNKIANGCKIVKQECMDYLKTHTNFEELNLIKGATTQYRNRTLIQELKEKNATSSIIGIDIQACYWNLLHNLGVLSDKTFNKYVDVKNIRLIAVGNLNKRITIINFDENGKQIGNPFSYKHPTHVFWDYVVSRSWDLALQAKKDIKLVAFRTDCFYILPESEKYIINLITSNNLKYRIEKKALINL